MPTLTANIFAMAINRINSHNKAGGNEAVISLAN
jgi:hypothetical protein